MKFLHHKRQAGVLAVLSVLLGAAALMLGIGGAHADTCTTTSGSVGDATVYVPGVVAADLDTEHPAGSSRDPGFWACAVPPDQGAGTAVRDNNTGTAGYQVEAATCGQVTANCTMLGQTGAEVDPATNTNQPYDATTGTGGSVGTGPGTCVYIDGGSPTCSPGGIEVAGLTVNEGDAAVTTVHNPNGPWVTAGGPGGVGVQLPYGFGVMVGRGTNSSAETVDGRVAGAVDVTTDVGGCYVSYNTDASTCS